MLQWLGIRGANGGISGWRLRRASVNGGENPANMRLRITANRFLQIGATGWKAKLWFVGFRDVFTNGWLLAKLNRAHAIKEDGLVRSLDAQPFLVVVDNKFETGRHYPLPRRSQPREAD